MTSQPNGIFFRAVAAVVVFCIQCSASAGDLLFVQVASTSNPSVADFTKSLNTGIELAFNRVNRSGELKAGILKLTLQDDQFSTSQAVEIVKRVAKEPDVLGLMGCVGTPALAELSKSGVLVEANLASIAPFTGAGALLRERNIFPVRASYEVELERLLKQAAELHQKRVAIVWWKAGVGPLLSTAAVELAQKYKIELTANVGFEVAQEKAKLDANIDEATKAAANSKPNAVLIVSAGQSGYQLVRSIRTNVGSGVPIYSISALAWKDVIKSVGIDVAKGLVISQAVPFPYSGVNTPIVQEYLQDMAAAKLEPDYASLEGYLGGRIAAMALLRIHGPVTRETFLKAISTLGRFESGEFRVDYTPSLRTSMKSADITMISSSGRLVR